MPVHSRHNRRRTRWAAIAGTVLLAIVVCAGCGKGAGPTKNSSATSAHIGGSNCTTREATSASLTGVHPDFVPVPSSPLGVVTAADGKWSFVSLASSIGALSDGSFPPRLEHQIPLGVSAFGEALTPDGRYLLVADGAGGALVVDVDRIEADIPDAVVGTLASDGHGSIEVAVTTDGRFAFVSLEGSGGLAVFNLATALSQGFGPNDFIGIVPLGEAPVGLAISPDGKWLYATSEAEPGARSGGLGTLSVVDVRKAESAPAQGVASTVAAGCSPVRVVVSADGATVWITARGSNELLAFSSARLVSDPVHALVARVPVGAAPVGLALVNGDARVVVANSNRFNARGATAQLTVVDAQAALDGRPAVLGTVSAGRFPREMAASETTLLVTNYDSDQVEAIRTKTLP